VTLEHAKLFREIAEARSVSRGAEAAGISQSAASQHVHEVERQLDAQLLDRSTRPFELTEAGVLYYEFCRDVLRLQHQFDEVLSEVRGRVRHIVRVAAIYSVGISDMSRLEGELARRMPQAQLQVEYLRPEKVYDSVLAERMDLGLISYPQSNREIVAIHWRDDEMMLAAAPSHPLAALPSVSPDSLLEQDFVAFDDELRVGREIKRYLRESNARVRVVMHFDNTQTMKEAVALGAGVSIMPARVLRSDIEQGRLVAIPIAGCNLVRPLGIIHRRRKKFQAGAQAFLDLLRQEAAPHTETEPA
jgi:DNA-binding transcriptional LysR family regulator